MHQQSRQEQAAVVQPMMPPWTCGQNPRWSQIIDLCDAIALEFHPEKIVLFGSYAYGTPRPDSDVDLLVVMPFEGSPFRQAAVILSHVVRTVGVLPLDLLVRTAEQVQERLLMGDRFMRDIMAHGRVMYCRSAPDANACPSLSVCPIRTVQDAKHG